MSMLEQSKVSESEAHQSACLRIIHLVASDRQYCTDLHTG